MSIYRRLLASALAAVMFGGLMAVPSHADPLPISTTNDAIRSCNMPGEKVWLSFDDGGSPRQVKAILNVLKKKNVKAMFFPTGAWAASRPKLMRKIVRQGHIVGSHTYNHPNLETLSSSAAEWQIRNGPIANTTPALLRPPYGAGAFNGRIQRIASDLGYQMCFWSVDTRDWSPKTSKRDIIRRVKHGQPGVTPAVGPNGHVLMHMQGRYTGDALPKVIKAIRDKGLNLPRRHD